MKHFGDITKLSGYTLPIMDIRTAKEGVTNMVLIDMEMPDCCLQCPFYANGGCKVTMRLFPAWMNVARRPIDCPMKPFTPPEPQITTNIYDQEEIHHGCAVQILRNSMTGEVSVGWLEEKEDGRWKD